MFCRLKYHKINDNIVQTVKEQAKAMYIDLLINNTKINRNRRLIPISAGTTATELEAKITPLFNAMKIKATIMVEGKVPKIPPVFVPYFSAITVIIITTKAERTNGIIV